MQTIQQFITIYMYQTNYSSVHCVSKALLKYSNDFSGIASLVHAYFPPAIYSALLYV